MSFKSRFALSGLVAVGALALVSSTSLAVEQMQDTDTPVRAVLRNASGDELGRASFSQQDGQVIIQVVARGLPPEFHGFHVHGVAKCDAPDFTSAGSHFNPNGQRHPTHAGDLPALLVNRDGTAQARVATDRFRVADLLAGTGTALIVHANRDNYANIPTRYAPAPDDATLSTGDAGARIACGVIEAATDSPDDEVEG
jgi:Cu-Zn family superoxide dismutase